MGSSQSEAWRVIEERVHINNPWVLESFASALLESLPSSAIDESSDNNNTIKRVGWLTAAAAMLGL